jgi:hypothetical protein
MASVRGHSKASLSAKFLPAPAFDVPLHNRWDIVIYIDRLFDYLFDYLLDYLQIT